MAASPKAKLEFEYEELVDLIVALRARAEVLAIRSPEFAGSYSRLADKIMQAGRDMLGDYAYA